MGLGLCIRQKQLVKNTIITEGLIMKSLLKISLCALLILQPYSSYGLTQETKTKAVEVAALTALLGSGIKAIGYCSQALTNTPNAVMTQPGLALALGLGFAPTLLYVKSKIEEADRLGDTALKKKIIALSGTLSALIILLHTTSSETKASLVESAKSLGETIVAGSCYMLDCAVQSLVSGR